VGDFRIDDVSDIVRLGEVFDYLTEMRNDAQQRSWAIEDDAFVIKDNLEEFTAIVREAHPEAVIKTLRGYQSIGQVTSFEILETVIAYFQMETRLELRMACLDLFTAVVALDADVPRVLQVTCYRPARAVQY